MPYLVYFFKRFTLFTLRLFAACKKPMPNWLSEQNHTISPDGNAAIYAGENEHNEIRGGIWFTHRIASGGAGLFLIQTADSSGLILSWLSDSVALIEYPSDAKFLSQEDNTSYFGRTVKFEYRAKR